ncbi:hypothetical protein L1987_33545 [Smallanthus sonchifolius]|uniref:Uncharacterized protein n=1 Tax=Smallanthus sonchifolius TaxID=185202 RepID=A0ACB9HRD1_9ASTR|nr:hypothetical protein L1987_33545 [Smallanthus sonchifolius]
MICFDAGFNDSPPQSLSGYLLVTTNPPGYLIFIAQVSYLQLLFLQVIRGCLLEGRVAKLHQCIGKIIWSNCMSYMVKKVGSHMFNSPKMETTSI